MGQSAVYAKFENLAMLITDLKELDRDHTSFP